MAAQPVLSGMRLVMSDFGASRGIEAPYNVERRRIEMNDIALPFHTGEWRSLGGGPNTFAIESAVDELALKLNKDPVAFRLQNLGPDQARLKHCLSRVKAMCDARPRPDILGSNQKFGRGYACGIYRENSYVAAAFDVIVDFENKKISTERCYVTLDVGLTISPDQIKAQIEGCALMAIGQMLMEAAPIGDGGLSANSFSAYPTPTMDNVPDFEIDIIDNRATPPAGVGQAPIIATIPALANAIRNATGYRAQKLPIDFNDLPAL
jgi:isoquinoline 1-oxidoreductase beta subunit